MSLLKCPKCGEQFSDSYKKCPFCAEEDMLAGGKKLSKKNRRVSDGRTKSPSIIGPALLIVVLLLIAVLAYLFFGDSIVSLFQKEESQDTQVEDTVDDTDDTSATDDTQTTDDTTEDTTTTTEEITLSEVAIDMMTGETKTLTASTEVTWATSNSQVAVVDDATGEVKAVGAGTAVITATGASGAFAVCNVTVSASTAASTTTTPTTTAPANLTLKTTYGALTPNAEGVYDITVKKSDSYNLIVDGTSSTVTWNTSNANVITIDANGLIHPVGKGTATITATVDGTVLSCIVRVNG